VYAGRTGVDQPVAITRVNYVWRTDFNYPGNTYSPTTESPFTIVPFWTITGDPQMGVLATGDINRCNPSNTPQKCIGFSWTSDKSALDREGSIKRAFWHGSLLESKRDKSGLSYMRNRYYDPQTGRFTQEDPIGLAGGLNLYGFGGGDPVTYSDPFGLCRYPLAGGLGGLQCAIEDLIGGIVHGPGILWSQIKSSPHKGFVVNLALVPATVAEGPEKLLFQGSRTLLREAIREGSLAELSGSQGLKLLKRLGEHAVDEVEVALRGNGEIRAAFSRQIDNITEVTHRVFNRAGEQTGMWIERFNQAGERVY
jgi:RHS repeat-associated protein